MHIPYALRSVFHTLALGACLWHVPDLAAQSARIYGRIDGMGEGVPYANVVVSGSYYGVVADSLGNYELAGLPPGSYVLRASSLGYVASQQAVVWDGQAARRIDFDLLPDPATQQEVVITGTMKEVQRMNSPVPVEVFHPGYFRKNPTANIFEALQNVNGVRPQLNCNVCNTGDIHINGLEGPYTMVLLDGMPIVSGLSTVYGLMGIPNSLIERVEIVKGPASSLYGSEAVGGLINIITKKPQTAPRLSADVFGTSWQDVNADLGLRMRIGERASALTGINVFHYDHPIDHNSDNFTDVALQQRISVFQKWTIRQRGDRLLSLAGRYFYEDRWGGEMNWTPAYRGGDSIYGESIHTRRWELIGSYQLPLREQVLLSFSFNNHDQNSVYGDMPYLGQQAIGFVQATWDKTRGRHDLLAGAALRYTYYDDNTPATMREVGSRLVNRPDTTWLPGVFVQDEIALAEDHRLLLGLRYDHHSRHGHVWTPRLAYKWSLGGQSSLRLNAGTGFRAVSLFTEDHAALTGAREVRIAGALAPERSYNANLNFLHKVFTPAGHLFGFDVTVFYTYFTNRILPDYDSDPDLILYDNLDGYATVAGASFNANVALAQGLKVMAGATYMDSRVVEQGVSVWPVLNERFGAVWAVSYTLPGLALSLDYTGNLYSPMRLPVLGDLDPRAATSPWWSLQNIQLTYAPQGRRWEVYGGVKNLLNYTPPANSIARAHDPFDRQVQYGPDGQVLPTPENPYALTFDPSYVFAPNQGIRGFAGIRYRLP
ncbi:MAG: TonB-dependent receptor [Bacteroidia bacterium]